MILQIFCVLLLLCPLAYALWEDRDGDSHPNNDLLDILIIGVVAALSVATIHPMQPRFVDWLLDALRAGVFSASCYIALFPYLVNIMHYKRGVTADRRWWDHLSLTAWPDKWWLWRELHWSVRMILLILILATSTIIYFR